jgi:hypothetical protein
MIEVVSPDPFGQHAVVEFTGHSIVMTDRDPTDFIGIAGDAFGGATHPDALRWLAGSAGWIGSLDVVLVHVGDARVHGDRFDSLARRDDLDDHPRVRRARAHRRGVVVYGDESGLVTIGRGLVDRLEISVELFDPAGMAPGAGRHLLAASAAAWRDDEPLWARVAPGNAASLRLFLACGFVPVGSEVLLVPAG